MKKHAQFHGSDLEEIEKIYHIPKEEIVCFGANVNPLGLSAQVKKQLSEHLDIITAYPDRKYSSLRQAIGRVAARSNLFGIRTRALSLRRQAFLLYALCCKGFSIGCIRFLSKSQSYY